MKRIFSIASGAFLVCAGLSVLLEVFVPESTINYGAAFTRFIALFTLCRVMRLEIIMGDK